MNTNISITHGSEGPRHDPYSYTELTVSKGNGWTTVHRGLAEWVEHCGERTECTGMGMLLDNLFEDYTGLTIKQAERIVRKIHERPYREHRKHGGFEWRSGFPGESLCICKCGHVVDSSFNESAII